MSKLHFEHGSTDGAYSDAYKNMLEEAVTIEQQEAKDNVCAKYDELVAKRDKLNESIKRFYKFNTEILEEHVSDEDKKLILE